jgi:ABC-type polysaccharide/polyol phosphate export permease
MDTIDPSLQAILGLNPLAALIEIVRAPLLGGLPATRDWLIAGVSTAATLALGWLAFRRYRARITYWL